MKKATTLVKKQESSLQKGKGGKMKSLKHGTAALEEKRQKALDKFNQKRLQRKEEKTQKEQKEQQDCVEKELQTNEANQTAGQRTREASPKTTKHSRAPLLVLFDLCWT